MANCFSISPKEVTLVVIRVSLRGQAEAWTGTGAAAPGARRADQQNRASDRPPRVDYELTSLGATLHSTIRALVTWTETHQNEIAAARTAYDARMLAEQQAAEAEAAERAEIARGALASTRS